MGVVGPKEGERERQDRAWLEAGVSEGAGSPDPWDGRSQEGLGAELLPAFPFRGQQPLKKHSLKSRGSEPSQAPPPSPLALNLDSGGSLRHPGPQVGPYPPSV